MATSLLLLVSALSVAEAPGQRVHLIFDSTYSMGLPAGELTRAERILTRLPEVLQALHAQTVYLSVLGHGDEPAYRGEFGAIESAVEALIGGPVYGRASVTRALSLLRLPSTASPDSVLLVTDAEEPTPVAGSMAAGVPLHLYVLETGTPSNDRTVETLLPRLTTMFSLSPDGDLQTVSPAAAVLSSPSGSRTSPNDTTDPSRGPTTIRIILLLLAAAATIILVLVAGYLTLEHLRFVRLRARIRAYNAVAPAVSVSIRGAAASTDAETRTYPFTIGFSPSDGLQLPQSAANDRFTLADRVTIDRSAGSFLFKSTAELRVAGILRTEGPVSPGLQVRVGRVRLSIDSVEQRKLKREPRPYHVEKLPIAGVSAVAAILLAVFAFHVESEAPPQSQQPSRMVSPPPSVISVQRSYGRPMPDPPRVFSEIEEIPWFDADFLAIHAHPDDEALDFGSLLATLTASGRRGVQVLLTDGESGQDLHPERPTRDGYPLRELRGSELARVRVREAQRSLSWLGVEHYVRLGYPNHPYNSIRDEMSPQQLLERWGGAEYVAERLTTLINGYTPEIVISPDRPSAVVEHFEHDATGIVSSIAFEQASQAGYAPRVHLVSVDPLQARKVPDLHLLSAWDAPGNGHSVSARDRQIAALDAHLTQLDAHVNGVESRMGLLYEFYRVVAGHSSLSELIPQLLSPINIP